MSKGLFILTVDRNQRNLMLLTEFLHKQGFETICGRTLEEVDKLLDHPEGIRLALVDVSEFDVGIWPRCDCLRQNGIPFLVISRHPVEQARLWGLRHGAQAVLGKPLSCQELLILVQRFAGSGYESNPLVDGA